MTTPTASDPPGTAVHVDYRKWDGTPHWQSMGTLLGVDEHGCWVGFPEGTHFERPGAAFDIECDSVSLFPGGGYTPAFNESTGRAEQVVVYVDTTTPPVWSRTDDGGWRVTMIDLDLDVVRRANGFAYVDDEDEFAEHQRQFGYPADVIRRAEDDTRAVFGALRDGRPPFDDTGWRWMRRLAETLSRAQGA
ncbi:MAG TPA: DUF402 domain-containing protein [Flexivirga sp.]|uniref:DUF402 domain-containing protein n=1 Tax=Flexivirga sp. TaxID=1962927 RepID=UPI002BA85B02|nr:DUF402 domain-containing protein [Flexivirga sp.]HWC23122.1 DUF402 domain-containing protein [Flexivirga sp.]